MSVGAAQCKDYVEYFMINESLFGLIRIRLFNLFSYLPFLFEYLMKRLFLSDFSLNGKGFVDPFQGVLRHRLPFKFKFQVISAIYGMC